VAALALTLGASRWCLPEACDYLDTTSPFVRQASSHAWHGLTATFRESTIAYTGINLPYPLSGPHLTNRVVYVNIDGHPRWALHDLIGPTRGALRAVPPLLAMSSGELRPLVQRPARAKTPPVRGTSGWRIS